MDFDLNLARASSLSSSSEWLKYVNYTFRIRGWLLGIFTETCSETYENFFFVFLRLWARLEPRDAFPYIKCAKRTHFPFGETRKTEVFQYLQKMKINHENEQNVRYFGENMLQQKKCCTSKRESGYWSQLLLFEGTPEDRLFHTANSH